MKEKVRELMDQLYELNPKELSISRYKSVITIEAIYHIEIDEP